MISRTIFTASAAIALAACGGGDKPAADEAKDAAATETAASTAAVAAPATASAAGGAPTKDFVVGKWGTDGDCALAFDLKADGTSDGPFGNWTYSDGVIGFPDTPEAKITVTKVDDKTMDSVNAQGGKHKMTRC
jgi:hypothetical protein